VVNPTLVFDSVKTFESIGVLQQSISWTEGEVVEGAKIVDRGEIVTPEIERKIRSMQKALMQTELETSEFYSYLTGSGVCIIFLLLLFFFYLYVYRRKLLDDMRNVLFFTILMGIVIAVSYMLLSYVKNVEYIYFIPFVWVPVITRVFYDSRTAIFLHIITVSVVSIGVQTPYHFLLIQLVAGIVSVVSLRDMTQRAQLATTASFVLLTYSLLYTAFCLMQNASWESLLNINWMYYIYFAVNAVLVVCAYGLIFLFERSFGLLSSITLVELTNVNSNLMLQFAEQAPGTFQHSMQVSNLATEAAKRIGAKVLLVRTGALYHDIGKMSHPEYFIENQAGGYNPLLEMTNEQAAKVIIDHVKEGERIARRHKLPEVIIHFILSHHGDSQTRYFYNTAINEAKQAGLDPSTVNAADYTYPGPRPTTKEAAILTIADAVEARSRSLKEMTPQSISDMVDDMVDILIRDGQLSETPLSFKDLEEIRKVFKQKLMEINHHRITYPTVE
jgi:putative nucleotidyltransferase with HDIG domain